MDKVNPNDLARLIGSLEAYAKIAKPESQWMPRTVFALLDELEQYRKDAERWKFAYARGINLDVASEMHVDKLIEMAKEGGSNG